MEIKGIFESVVHDTYLNSMSKRGRFNDKYQSVLVVEASHFLAERMEKEGQQYKGEHYHHKGKIYIIFREPEETVSKYNPGDIINITAVRTTEGLILSL